MKRRPHVTVVAATMVASLATLAACGHTTSSSGSAPSAAAPASASSTLTIAALVDATSFDPAQAHQGHYVQYYQPVYDSLLRRTPSGAIVPMLATKWAYNPSHTQLTLTLRNGVRFTDGTPVNANAVELNLNRFRNGNGPDASTLSLVSAVLAPNPSTVVIDLKSPDPDLINDLAYEDSFIASPKAIAAGHIATDPVGSGPYMLDKAATQPGSQYTFIKNPHYWDPSLQKFAKIVIKPITDTTATLDALLSGQVDAATLTSKQVAQAKAAGMVEHLYHTDWEGLFIFDRAGQVIPALRSVKVRQALNYAIDKRVLLKQVGEGLGQVTSQILAPGTPGYLPSLDHAYPYDPAKARRLLQEAGYGNGFSITMPTVQGFVDPALTAAIGQDLKNVGINVTWQNVVGSAYIADLVAGKFPAAWFSEAQGSAWLTATVELAPNATYNPEHTTDPVVEKLISTVQTGSPSQQTQAATALNRYIVQQAWFVPFYRPDVPFFTDKKVTVQPQPLQVVPSIYNYSPAG